MRQLFVILVAMLISIMSNIGANPADSRKVQLSFDAANETPYVMEVATNIAIDTFWIPVTNFPAGPTRMVTMTVDASQENRYFRLSSPATNSTNRPFLQAGEELRFMTNFIVIPSGTGDSFGNATGGLFRSPVDYQTLYSRSNFVAAKTDRLTIVGVAFRIDEATTEVDVIPSKVGIWLSTFTRPRVSRFRSENWGDDRTLVYFHENVRFAGTRDIGDVSTFQIYIPFDSPFRYDPTAGDLLVDFYTERPYIYGHGGFADGIIRDDGSIFSIGDGMFNGVKPNGTILKIYFREQITP